MPSIYIVLEKKIPNEDTFVSGNALSKNNEELEALAKRLNVTPLMAFFSVSKDELASLVDDEAIEGISAPDEQWFSADAGLQTVNSLLSGLPNSKLRTDSRVDSELQELANVLELAKSHGVRWHLAVDY